MTTEHRWSGNPFGVYCGVCGHQYVPEDSPADFIEACKTINRPGSNNDECPGARIDGSTSAS